jgi:hypothetical protein
MCNSGMNLQRNLRALALPALLLTPAVSFAATPDSRVVALIKASGIALHVSAMQSIRVVHLKGTFVNLGLHGTGDRWNEIGGVRSSLHYSTPPLAGGSGWDGSDSWSLDQTGLVYIDASEGGPTGRAVAISQAFLSNYDLWKPNFGGATVVWEGSKSDKGRDYDVLGVTAPGSKLPLDVWFDHTTHLPMRSVQDIGPGTFNVTFADYRPVHGLIVPFSVDTSVVGNDTAFTAATGDVNPANAAAQFAKPTSQPHDFSIAGGAAQATVPMRLVGNIVYVDVMLNGKGPYHFIFDTGGQNVVDPAVAAEVGVSGSGETQIGGSGADTLTSSFGVVKSLQIGDATVNDQAFVVLPVHKLFAPIGAVPTDGVIGFEVLSRFVTTYDYGDNTVTFHMPGTYTKPAAASVVPISLQGTQPQFPCSISGVPTMCTLDTGAGGSLSFFVPFMKANPQVVPSKLTAPGVDGFGVGGPTLGSLGRTQTLTIGGFTLPNLIGDYPVQDVGGGNALPFLGANIGGPVWKRFTMTLDYTGQTMTLSPNGAFNAHDTGDNSGLTVINTGAIMIMDVRPGTPAATAGLTKGEVITSINGTPATSLGPVREALMGKPGDVLHLVVKSKDGTTHNVDLTLAEYV